MRVGHDICPHSCECGYGGQRLDQVGRCERTWQYLESMEMTSNLSTPIGVRGSNFQFRIFTFLCCLCFILFTIFAEHVQAEDKPFGISKRVPWTTSRLTGSPDPPPPYKIVRAFPKLTFKNPLLLRNAPGTERLFIGEQAGKLYSFPNNQGVAKADLFFDLTTEIQ